MRILMPALCVLLLLVPFGPAWSVVMYPDVSGFGLSATGLQEETTSPGDPEPIFGLPVLVGANAVTEAIAREVVSQNRTTVIVDGVSWRLDRFRSGGLMTVVGDARDAVTFEEAGLERDSVVVATTTNDELNLLVHPEPSRSEAQVEDVSMRPRRQAIGRNL